ncbi:hypothetical protein R1D02_25040, partial [Escherichia coli]
KKYSKARLNAACARALKTKVWRLSGIKSILEKGLDKRKRAARTVLTGMCYSVGSATRQGEQFADPVYRPVGYD